MISTILAQVGDFVAPVIDWHALAPELVLVVGINLVLFIDLWVDESKKWAMATLTGFVVVAGRTTSGVAYEAVGAGGALIPPTLTLVSAGASGSVTLGLRPWCSFRS